VKITSLILFCATASIFGISEKNKTSDKKIIVSASIIEYRISHDSILLTFHDTAYYRYYDIIRLHIKIKVINHSQDAVRYVIAKSYYPFLWGTDSRDFYPLSSDVINYTRNVISIPPDSSIETEDWLINSAMATPMLPPDDPIKMRMYIDSMYTKPTPGTYFRCWVKIIECNDCAGLVYFPKAFVLAQQDSFYKEQVKIGKFDGAGKFIRKDSALNAEIIWSNKVTY
jgi:hypothetical protein